MIPNSHSIREKYGLSTLSVDDYKDFSIEDYSKIRMACHFTGKRIGRKFSTRKMKNKKNITFVRVFRVY